MPKSLLLCSLLMVFGCASEDKLNRICGNVGPYQCYGVWTEHYQDPQLLSSYQAESMRELAEEELVGICQYGTPTCDLEGNIIDCEGAVYPERTDVCDNIDNDCDGLVDEGIGARQSQYFQYEPNPCLEELGSMLGECKHALVECVDGEFVCSTDLEWLDVEIGEETLCDLKDNNCNGRVDDLNLVCTDLMGNPIACTCYEGPIGTEQYGQCNNGFYQCVNGEIICDGQVLPSVELCDEVDNNCNGIIDDTGDTLSSEYDIVFIIDTSGSMCDEVGAVAGALEAYVEQFENNNNFRFAIVIMSSYSDSLVVVDTDFTDLATVRNRLLSLGCDGSGSEASLDALKDVCSDIQLSWRDDAIRLTFVFTDEDAQTYESPATTKNDVINACIQSGTLPFIWHRSSYTDFNYITANSNGRSFTLINDWEQIFDDLNSIVITLCGL